jgi:hypothetical protein
VQLIVYDGWPVALAEADEVHLHPALLELAELDEGHALVRFACALELHAFEVATGLELGLFDQGRAERCSRELLMPAGEFLAAADESDTDLAGASVCRSSRSPRGDASSVHRRPPVRPPLIDRAF